MAVREKSLNIAWSQFEVCNPDTQPFLKEDLAEVTKCIWFLRSDEELALTNAANTL